MSAATSVCRDRMPTDFGRSYQAEANMNSGGSGVARTAETGGSRGRISTTNAA
jgi:hypothetical protein